MDVILFPDGALVPHALEGPVESVIEWDHDGQEPGDDGQDLVNEHRVLAVLISLGERVDWITVLALDWLD
jgi:hypothetical protein